VTLFAYLYYIINALKLLTKQEIATLITENQKLKKLVSGQQEIISKNEVIISKKEASIAEAKALIARLQRMLFGQKRERFETPENQLHIFQEILEDKKQELQEDVKEKVELTYQREKKSHPGRTKLPENLDVVEQIIEPEGDLSQMTYIGQEVTEELGYQPERFFLHRIIRKKYAPKSGEGSFKIAPLPLRVIDKAIPSVELLTQLLVDKYIDHLPLYRIRQRFARNGIKIANSTIDGWVKTCLNRLEILYEYVQKKTKLEDYLQVDETTLKVQDPKVKGKTHLGYYWVYHAPASGLIFFEYQPSRAGKHVWNNLKDFKGYLQTDGYAGYNALAARPEIVHLACMAHLRRKFEEALTNDKFRAERALIYIQSLYFIEKQAKEEKLTALQIKKLRLQRALPIVNEMGKWIAENNSKVLPKSSIGKAFRYAIERWDEMTNYILDGNLQIDNNQVENAIRPIAIGRKNYLFAGSHKAAQRAAIIYTFFAQCKKADINPSQWLKHTLLHIMDTKVKEIETLLPQNFINN